MKKITILSALIFCISLLANAQTEKGRYMVGGSVGFSSQKQKSEFGNISTDVGTSTSINLTPSFGLFVADERPSGRDALRGADHR